MNNFIIYKNIPYSDYLIAVLLIIGGTIALGFGVRNMVTYIRSDGKEELLVLTKEYLIIPTQNVDFKWADLGKIHLEDYSTTSGKHRRHHTKLYFYVIKNNISQTYSIDSRYLEKPIMTTLKKIRLLYDGPIVKEYKPKIFQFLGEIGLDEYAWQNFNQ